MKIIMLIPILMSCLTTLVILPSWIKRAKKAGITGKDMNKYKKKEIPEAGGISVVSGFIIGLFIYIAIKTFYFKTDEKIIELFALGLVILILSLIGLIDDLLGWKIGLRRRTRMLLILFAAIPLVVINAGQSSISLPFISRVNIGLIFPLIVIPIAILGASISFNFIAGYNGLEAGQGILILAALIIATFFRGDTWLSVVALCMVASLLAFFLFNKYPAKIFPGDAMTYSVGALIAGIAILGNMERFALFIFIPYILETVLKVRGKLIKESFAQPKKDGSLDMPYKKIYGLEHLSLWVLKKFKKKVREKEIVYSIFIFEITLIIIGFILFRKSIFL